jgi:hypothetical protein
MDLATQRNLTCIHVNISALPEKVVFVFIQ